MSSKAGELRNHLGCIQVRMIDRRTILTIPSARAIITSAIPESASTCGPSGKTRSTIHPGGSCRFCSRTAISIHRRPDPKQKRPIRPTLAQSVFGIDLHFTAVEGTDFGHYRLLPAWRKWSLAAPVGRRPRSWARLLRLPRVRISLMRANMAWLEGRTAAANSYLTEALRAGYPSMLIDMDLISSKS